MSLYAQTCPTACFKGPVPPCLGGKGLPAPSQPKLSPLCFLCVSCLMIKVGRGEEELNSSGKDHRALPVDLLACWALCLLAQHRLLRTHSGGSEAHKVSPQLCTAWGPSEPQSKSTSEASLPAFESHKPPQGRGHQPHGQPPAAAS